jgi:hypothetical protein
MDPKSNTACNSPVQPQVNGPIALPPYLYPRWIWLTCIVIAAMFVISMVGLPSHYRTAVLVKKAEKLERSGDRKGAIRLFEEARTITPKSRRTRIGLAISYFKSTSKQDHARALEVLEGVSLEAEEWFKLKKAMPREYQPLFTQSTE